MLFSGGNALFFARLPQILSYQRGTGRRHTPPVRYVYVYIHRL